MSINIKKLVIITAITLASIALIAILISIVPWLVIMIGGNLSPNPSSPEITYGEFPICLEYKIDDQYAKIEDVLICEFDGFGFSEGSGEKFRKWKARLKSGNSRITIFKNDSIEIYCYPVSEDGQRLSGVCMGDTEYYPSGGTKGAFPDALYKTDYEDKANGYIITAEDMKNKYNLELIDLKYPIPIENKF